MHEVVGRNYVCHSVDRWDTQTYCDPVDYNPSHLSIQVVQEVDLTVHWAQKNLKKPPTDFRHGSPEDMAIVEG